MPRTNNFDVPVFYNNEDLIKHVSQEQDMEWQYRDTELYEHAWQNQAQEDLWVEDVTQMLSPTPQTHLVDFKEDRYRVLQQERWAPEGRVQETFEELDDALEYVEDNYEIEPAPF